MIKKGDEILAEISDINSEGKGISKLPDGFVIFSENTVPGDRALIRIKRKKSNYAEASLISIEKPSKFRTEPRCSHFGICGGCKIQNYDYEKQILYKTNVVKNAFERIGGFTETEIPEALRSDKIFFYRNKMEFSFSDDEWTEVKESGESKNIFALGLHVPKFHSKIINISRCYLQSDLSNEILNFTREFFESRSIKVYSTKSQTGFLRFLIIRQSANTNEIMVNLITYSYDEHLMKEYSESLNNKYPEITTIINSTSSRIAQIAFGENEYVLKGKGYITESLEAERGRKYNFKISPQSFFQTNTKQAEKLFDVLIKFSGFEKTDNILDLYCGTGSISVLISEYVNKVTGVELINDSINDAGENAKLNNTSNAEFICSNIKDFIENKNNLTGFNKLILDPPRSGLHPKICEVLSATNFDKIVYVSCNPHTQARDLKIICSGGSYKIGKVQPVDMFPHTYHVENVVSLEKVE